MSYSGTSADEESTCNAEDPGSNPGLGRSPGDWIGYPTPILRGFAGGSDVKESTYNVGDMGLIPELGRVPEGRHGNPLQYSCLENPHGQRSLVSYRSCGHKESNTE